MARIFITPGLSIDESEIEEHFILASGPGGQNVNKVATAVQLRFAAGRSPAINFQMLTRLASLAGRRMTKDSILVIDARRLRSQEQNRADARDRLIDLLRAAAIPPKPRRTTRVPRAAKKKRLEKKLAHGKIKKLRARPDWD